VNDHCRAGAFAREILLFDRLVVPTPATTRERQRWRHPNPENPKESWEPDLLDELLAILGTQEEAGEGGARLVWTAPWSERLWTEERSRRDVAARAGNDAFSSTRWILAMGATPLPDVVEVMAAFPSTALFEEEVHPTLVAPTGASAATALIMLARPYLVPDSAEPGDLRPLRDAVKVAGSQEFRSARAAYHDWLREFVEPLRQDGETLEEVHLNPQSLQLAKERLDRLVANERKVVEAQTGRRPWRRTEWAMTVIGFGLSLATALVNPVAGLGVASSVAGFAGWAAGTNARAPEPDRPLNGASIFLAAERPLGIAAR
jgi:hypothetical protein